MNNPEVELTRFRRTLVSAMALAIHCAQQLRRDRAQQMAAALAYRTIFGLIPTLVLSLIAMRFFYANSVGEPLRRMLDYVGLSEISVGGEGDQLGVWIETVVERVSTLNFAAIGVAGVAVLIYAALSLMVQVEHSFNTIYKAAAGRSILARITQYWTLLTLAPIGFLGSFWIGDRFQEIVQTIGGGHIVSSFGVVAAFAVSWLVMLLAFVMIPHTRVKLRPALVGSFVTALLWELGKAGFAMYLGFATGYARFYGSLALIPIFMLWVYITWLIVLFGLELAYAVQTLDDGLQSFVRKREKNQHKVQAPDAVAMLVVIGQAFGEGQSLTASQAGEQVGASPEDARELLGALSELGWIHPVERSDEEPTRWALSTPPDRIMLEEVARRCTADDEAGSAAAQSARCEIRTAVSEALTGRTLESLLPATPPTSD